VPIDNAVLAFPRETVSSAYPVRIQYAVALSQDVSFGVVSYWRWTGRSRGYRTRLTSDLGPHLKMLR
jgi:hypothetical protein